MVKTCFLASQIKRKLNQTVMFVILTQLYCDAKSFSLLSEMEENLVYNLHSWNIKKTYVYFNSYHPVTQGTMTIVGNQESGNRKTHCRVINGQPFCGKFPSLY